MLTDSQLLEYQEKICLVKRLKNPSDSACVLMNVVGQGCSQKYTVFMEENVFSLMSKALGLSPVSMTVINLEEPQLSHMLSRVTARLTVHVVVSSCKSGLTPERFSDLQDLPGTN